MSGPNELFISERLIDIARGMLVEKSRLEDRGRCRSGCFGDSSFGNKRCCFLCPSQAPGRFQSVHGSSKVGLIDRRARSANSAARLDARMRERKHDISPDSNRQMYSADPEGYQLPRRRQKTLIRCQDRVLSD